MANVRFQAHMQVTTIDPPQLMKFVRSQYPDVILHRPLQNIYQLILKKKCLPTQCMRWCCAELKERSGAGTVTVIGIRRAESIRRAKRNEVEINNHKFSGSLDQFNRYRETEINCVRGKDKIILSPILHWGDHDIWQFIKSRNLPYCELYDMGFHRIGCIFCPMSNKKAIARERLMFPGVERTFKLTIKKLCETHNYGSLLGKNPDLIFEWWISKKNIKEFIADRIQQIKIKFDE